MIEPMRIGEALVAEGAITEGQLSEALAAQKVASGIPLGLVLTEQFNVPVEVVDQANVQFVLLPRFRKNLMTRLLSLSRSDKFAKGLDVTSFVSSISTVAEQFEVGVYKGRKYTQSGTGYAQTGEELGFVTTMDVQVTISTKKGHSLQGSLHAEHDSRTDMLVITDDETRIKEAIYYGVRTAFRSSR